MTKLKALTAKIEGSYVEPHPVADIDWDVMAQVAARFASRTSASISAAELHDAFDAARNAKARTVTARKRL